MFSYEGFKICLDAEIDGTHSWYVTNDNEPIKSGNSHSHEKAKEDAKFAALAARVRSGRRLRNKR